MNVVASEIWVMFILRNLLDEKLFPANLKKKVTPKVNFIFFTISSASPTLFA